MKTEKPPMELALQITGEVLKSNFPEFKAAALAKIDEMDYKLETDADFEKAAEDVKVLKATEDATKAAEDEALKQLSDVYGIIEGLREIRGASSECRLSKSKEIRDREEAIRSTIIEDAVADLDCHRPQQYRERITNALKGKRGKNKVKSWRDAATGEVEAIQGAIDEAREILSQFKEAHGPTLIQDEKELEHKSKEVLEGELHHRLEKEKLRQEAEAAKAKAEAEAAEAAKAAQEAAAKLKEKEEAPTPPEPLDAPEKPSTPQEMPKPPKVGTIAVGREENARVAQGSKAAQVAHFQAILLESFKPVRIAREQLTDPTVKQAAEALRVDFVRAFETFQAAVK